MNPKELLKQADSNFQRGNRDLAREYLSDLLTEYPDDEGGWMLMARVVDEKGLKIECYENVLRINPKHSEAQLSLARLKAPQEPITRPRVQVPKKARPLLRWVTLALLGLLLLGTTTYVVAMKNPNSTVGQLILPPTPISYAQDLPADLAAGTRAQVGEKYPEYAPLVDALIGFAVSSTDDGMDGAPERPGAPIQPSDGAALEARTTLENALPEPGSLNTVTLTEQQITSWLDREMKKSSDLPVHEVQVYLQNGTIEVWGMVDGSQASTAALLTGKLNLESGVPTLELTSLQIGKQVIPDLLLSQAGAWLNQVLTEKINEQVPGLQVMNINISSGLITISGMR